MEESWAACSSVWEASWAAWSSLGLEEEAQVSLKEAAYWQTSSSQGGDCSLNFRYSMEELVPGHHPETEDECSTRQVVLWNSGARTWLT